MEPTLGAIGERVVRENILGIRGLVATIALGVLIEDSDGAGYNKRRATRASIVWTVSAGVGRCLGGSGHAYKLPSIVPIRVFSLRTRVTVHKLLGGDVTLFIHCPQTGQLVSTRTELPDVPGLHPRVVLESFGPAYSKHFECSLCGETHHWDIKTVILNSPSVS